MPSIPPPRLHPARAASLVTLLAVALLSGCSGLPEVGTGQAPEPVPSDVFELPPAGTDLVGELQVAIARHEDTLPDIARRYDLGYEEIVAANPGVDPWLPGEGTPVVLPTAFILPPGPREGLVVNLATMRLFYYTEPEAGKPAVVVTHPVGIGREGWRTPRGRFRITQKIADPAWTVPASVRREHAAEGDPLPAVVPPGPDNPLGAFAMRLSNPNYLLHGTNKPWGVGMRVSHGCLRLYPEDIARLFQAVPKGTPVRIIDEPYLAGWRDGQLYLEAHAPLAELAGQLQGSLQPMEAAIAAMSEGRSATVNRDKAASIAGQGRGIPLPVTAGSPGLEEVLAAAPRVTSTPPWAPVDYTLEEGKAEPLQTAAAEQSPAGTQGRPDTPEDRTSQSPAAPSKASSAHAMAR